MSIFLEFVYLEQKNLELAFMFENILQLWTGPPERQPQIILKQFVRLHSIEIEEFAEFHDEIFSLDGCRRLHGFFGRFIRGFVVVQTRLEDCIEAFDFITHRFL